ncbi:hypothetical protein CsSME_00001624 [Camellia sinensis var. sinensis]
MHYCVARAIDCALIMLGGDEGVTALTVIRKFVTKTRHSNGCSLVLVNMRMVLDLRKIKKIDMNEDGFVDIDEFRALYQLIMDE